MLHDDPSGIIAKNMKIFLTYICTYIVLHDDLLPLYHTLKSHSHLWDEDHEVSHAHIAMMEGWEPGEYASLVAPFSVHVSGSEHLKETFETKTTTATTTKQNPKENTKEKKQELI